MLTKASSEGVRRRNRALVLAALRQRGPLSHTDIAEATALASATVSAITADLEHERILARLEDRRRAGRGRPRILFQQRRDSGYLVLVRISSDTTQYSLVNYAGTLMDRFEERRPSDSSTGTFVAMMKTALARLTERSRLTAERILAISISSKGLVAADEPLLVWSPIFGEQSIHFAAELSSRWPGRITLSNESLLVATALYRRRSAPPGGIATVSLGHSIGLGVVQADPGHAVKATAPNFGHMLHSPGGALCRCGSHGCIEAYAGFYAILRRAFDVPRDTLPAKFVPLAEMEKIAARARRGDRMTGHAFREAGNALGTGLARLLALYEARPIVFTGPGARFYDLMRAGVEEGLNQSLGVRLEGLPDITVSFDEEDLVFEGNLQKTLTTIDEDLFADPVAMGGAA